MKKKSLHFKKGTTFHLNQKDNKNSLDLYNWLFKELTFLTITIPNDDCCTGNLFLKADTFARKQFKDPGFSMRKWLMKRLTYLGVTIGNSDPCCPQTFDTKIFTGYITYSNDEGKSMDIWLKQSLTKMGISWTDPCC